MELSSSYSFVPRLSSNSVICFPCCSYAKLVLCSCHGYAYAKLGLCSSLVILFLYSSYTILVSCSYENNIAKLGLCSSLDICCSYSLYIMLMLYLWYGYVYARLGLRSSYRLYWCDRNAMFRLVDLCYGIGLMFILSALIFNLREVRVLFHNASMVFGLLNIIRCGVPHGLLGVGGRWWQPVRPLKSPTFGYVVWELKVLSRLLADQYAVVSR
jgi:hypothetical protein